MRLIAILVPFMILLAGCGSPDDNGNGSGGTISGNVSESKAQLEADILPIESITCDREKLHTRVAIQDGGSIRLEFNQQFTDVTPRVIVRARLDERFGSLFNHASFTDSDVVEKFRETGDFGGVVRIYQGRSDNPGYQHLGLLIKCGN